MKLFLTSIFSIFLIIGFGQQYSLSSQYMFNEASFNPATAGAKDYIPIHFNFRSQWVGFDGGAPVTQTLTAHADMGQNLGFGGNLYNEVTGPSRSTGMNLMLSYRLKLSGDNFHNLRGGIGLSLAQHLIDVNKLTTDVDLDPAIQNAYNNQFVPDADAGIYYTYGKNMSFGKSGFLGFSVKNVAQTKRDLFNSDGTITNTMKRHYYFNGGYNFFLGKEWILKTSTLVRFIGAKPTQVDVNAIVELMGSFWAGVGFRPGDAVSSMAGFRFGKIKCGYSYDATLSDIRKYSSGSHEIFLELQLYQKGKKPKKSWIKGRSSHKF